MLSLGACAATTEDVARYDLGPADAAGGPAAMQVQIRAPGWLDNTAIAYRLAYEDASRVRNYAHSRWLAPPAQLLAARLRQVLHSPAGAPPRELGLELEEFSQVFDSQQSSHVLLQVRATLSTGDLATREFVVQHPGGADAPGAVHGMQAAVAQLGHDLQAWLDTAPKAAP